ncbi:MAG: hypothetical protein M5U14_04605 [Acidimicrobiia bacterium]|nr:hypothetical protein [Acidimicrobiia bacterium]
MVLCHPHPRFGGSMRTVVIDALFKALPGHGVRCLRFNFRGVEGSEGAYGAGIDERLDALAAVEVLDDALPPGAPLVLAGWSFGGDVALSVRDTRVAAWLAIAPPLRFVDDVAGLATDPRPKLVALAQHDEVRSPDEVCPEIESWKATEVQVVPGASHLFVGRTDHLVDLAAAFVDSLAG